MNEWFTTALPIFVVPVSSTATAASWVPLAGRNRTPESACHIAMIGATAGKIDSPIGMSVRVVADWPGLKEASLYEKRDLKPTTDLRAVLKGLLRDHLRVEEAALAGKVFPESSAVKPVEGLLA